MGGGRVIPAQFVTSHQWRRDLRVPEVGSGGVNWDSNDYYYVEVNKRTLESCRMAMCNNEQRFRNGRRRLVRLFVRYDILQASLGQWFSTFPDSCRFFSPLFYRYKSLIPLTDQRPDQSGGPRDLEFRRCMSYGVGAQQPKSDQR